MLYGHQTRVWTNTDPRGSGLKMTLGDWEMAGLGKIELPVLLVFSSTVTKPAKGGSFVSVTGS